MKYPFKFFYYFLIVALFPFKTEAQFIFSEKDLEYKKVFLPYDVPYTFALKDKEFVMLQEVKKNHMKLGRYDQYFFEKWEKEIEFNKEENAPQIFVRGDSVITFSLTQVKENNLVRINLQVFYGKGRSRVVADQL